MSADEEDLSGQVLHGKYRLERRLGAGGFGAVYAATHLLGKATRAVKVIHRSQLDDPVACRMFLREAQAVMRISTPRAVVVHDVDRDEAGRMYIVMELLRGVTLREYLQRESVPGRGLPLEEALRIARGVCEALRAAHACKVIHRDLKPSNVMMVPGDSGLPEVKVVDFGIARLHSMTQSGETSTDVWVGAVGTPPYMSPEQCRGLDVDERSDLYSLGVLLYELISGRTPFRSKTSQGYAAAHLTETPIPLATACPEAHVPRELDRLVSRLLAKKPEERPRDATEVLCALGGPGATGSGAVTVVPASGKLARWRPILWVAIAGVLALVAWFLWPQGTSGPAVPRPAEVTTSGTRDVVEPVTQPPVAHPSVAPDATVTPVPGQVSGREPPRHATTVTARPRARPTRTEPPPVAGEEARAPGGVGASRHVEPPPTERPALPSPSPGRAAPASPERARPTPASTKPSEPWDSEFEELDRVTR